MASYRFLQYGALAVVVLAAMILTTPFSNAEELKVTAETRVEEMRLLINWGDVDNNVGTVGTGQTLAWDGTITLQSGNLVVLRKLIFKDANDRLLDTEGSSIRFQSDINSDMDGLFLRVFPSDGKNDTITFTLSDGFTVTRSLLSFVENREVTIPIRDGLSVRMKAEALILKRGDLRSQAAEKINELADRCKESGKTEEQCRGLLHAEQKVQETRSRAKIWDALNRQLTKLKDPTWASAELHPDVLFIMSKADLEKLTKSELGRMDLKRLSHMSDMVYKTLLRLAPERIGEMSTELQKEAMVLEGQLPENIRTVGALTEEQFQRFKRFLASLDQTERQHFVTWLGKLSPGAWDSLKALENDMILSLGRIVLAAPENKREQVLNAYLRQVKKLAILRIKLDQLSTRMSLDDAKRLENLLARLQGTVLWTGDETPMVLTAIDDFLAKSGALTREQLAKALAALESDVQQAIAENNVGILKEDLGLFSDVSATSWYAGFVGMMRSDKLLEGYKDAQGKPLGKYGPENNVTVGELLKIAMTTSANGTGSGTAMLPGAKAHWSTSYVARAEELHLTLVMDTSLDLNRPATRGEVIQAFLEAYGINPPTIEKSSFSDVFTSMPTARFIEFAFNHGAISGDDGKTTFRPDEKINRAEVAKIAIRMKQIFSTLFEKSTVEGDLES